MKFLIFALLAFSSSALGLPGESPNVRLEELHDKTILVFTPHPDDDVYGLGGTIALLNRNHNKVFIAIYTNDDKGSGDPEMTSQRLAVIRRHEEEVSEGMLGTPKENLLWMGYDDGMLEYAAQPNLSKKLRSSSAGFAGCAAISRPRGVV